MNILELFVPDISLQLSINAIAKKLKKHYRVTRVNVLSLVKKNLLQSNLLAGAKVITLNLKEVTFPAYMAYVEEPSAYQKITKQLPQMEDIIKAAKAISPSFCLGVFGSYANNTQKKGSDIDIFIMCESSTLKQYQQLIHQFPTVEDLIDWNVFTLDEFKNGLKTKGTLIYKEILRNKMILHGATIFYNLIAEVGAIEKD